ncbi:class I SAM-dependent methyltransferase [Sunxiuqinia sp. A32]|uniref:class I SAM-dependent methyltransferase n=1 Tax=Sunxiuqinia sp. A32 TaxID=3461496 RepID=UPI0040461E84
MDRLIKNIDKQILFNQDKNIVLNNIDLFQFSEETIDSISGINKLSPDSKTLLIDYATDKAIEEFCRVNQYYSFNSKAKSDLKKIYLELLDSCSNLTVSVETVSKKHYNKLKKWLLNNNPFAEKVYATAGKKINPVACSEYSQGLQIDLLKIDTTNLTQPVLDIGCGKNGYLVKYLANQGIDVRGIDRFSFSNPNFVTADWLEYKYETKKWGTIISNLGFTNHFNHHNLREDGKYIEYAKTFMNILHSLKIGGKFHYAPDLPFIEKYLNDSQFSIEKHELEEIEFRTTIITRLK